MKSSIAIDFKSKLSGPELATFSANVLARMKNNPAYAALKPLVDDHLEPAVERYLLALREAEDRGKVKLSEKRAARQRLIAILEDIALRLNLLAAGDETLVLDAGFNLRSANRQRREIRWQEPVDALRVVSVTPGQLNVRFKPLPQARVYALEWRLEGEQEWHNGVYNTSARMVLDDLPSRSDVWVRVYALGRGQRKSPASQPVRAFVL